MGGRVKIGIEFRISCSDTMLNYQLSKKFKLLENCEFNHLTISLIERNEINLIGVNNEKEPLMGISPVKLLFDRSLHSTWKEDNVTFLQYIWCANNI